MDPFCPGGYEILVDTANGFKVYSSGLSGVLGEFDDRVGDVGAAYDESVEEFAYPLAISEPHFFFDGSKFIVWDGRCLVDVCVEVIIMVHRDVGCVCVAEDASL